MSCTVIGACAHVFGTGLTPKYIPSFAWGSEGVARYEFSKALSDLANWKKMKGQDLTAPRARDDLFEIFLRQRERLLRKPPARQPR